MDERINKIAALANTAAYTPELTQDYVDGAPHIKHTSLRRRYGELVVRVFDEAKKHNKVPRILDIGAGEGSVTISFLELGATVVATDISESQLAALKNKCERFGDRLEIRCEDVSDTVRRNVAEFDIIVASSFLHHVPDYLGMINNLMKILTPNGQFFSFQDPLRYDSLGKLELLYSNLSYMWWRIFKGDFIGGLQRRLRRSRGVYLQDCKHDNAEFHVTRNGVDQDAISSLFLANGFECEIHSYFSTQNRFLQLVGEWLGIINTFAIVAIKSSKPSNLN